MRIDRLLCYLRFARSRTLAQRWINEGHIRRNGSRVTRSDLAVAPGDILTLPLKRQVLAIEILALPVRRGPAAEARECYRALDAGRPIDIAGGQSREASREAGSEGKSPP